jgi:hypothetical protein
MFIERIYKMEKKEFLEYEIASIATYTDEEILEELVRYSPTKQNGMAIQHKMSREVLALQRVSY